MLMNTSSQQGIGRAYAETRAAERERERTVAGPKWYVVQCIRGTDQQAISAFDRHGIEVYYPKTLQLKALPRRRMSSAQRQSGLSIQMPVEVALFPRYVFARFDMQAHRWRDVFDFAGTSGLMCTNGMPVFMTDEGIARIRRRADTRSLQSKETFRVVFDVGDGVDVTHGPFAGFGAVVEQGLDVPIEKLEPGMRIKVAVMIFGRATPVELEHWQVAKQEVE